MSDRSDFILVDTSVLTRLTLGQSARTETIAVLRAWGTPVLAPQSLYEFYSVATRPAESRGGLGLTTETARGNIEDFRTSFILFPDPPDLLDRWLFLVGTHDVKGRAAHDARLAAFALAHGVKVVATRDRNGFARYGLEERDPYST